LSQNAHKIKSSMMHDLVACLLLIICLLLKEIMSPLILSYKLGITNPTPLNKNLVLEI
jgi:hypothetical protein